MTSLAQGTLYTFANVACHELAETNVRFNEVYLCFRVDYDAVAAQKGPGSLPSSAFAAHYEELLRREDIRGCRVSLRQHSHVKDLPSEKKIRQ